MFFHKSKNKNKYTNKTLENRHNWCNKYENMLKALQRMSQMKYQKRANLTFGIMCISHVLAIVLPQSNNNTNLWTSAEIIIGLIGFGMFILHSLGYVSFYTNIFKYFAINV